MKHEQHPAYKLPDSLVIDGHIWAPEEVTLPGGKKLTYVVTHQGHMWFDGGRIHLAEDEKDMVYQMCGGEALFVKRVLKTLALGGEK
jgi:hypothetical protein